MIALLAALLTIITAPYLPASYACNGSTTAYSVPFPYLTQTDLLATSTTATGVVTTLALTTDYSLSVVSTSSTATLTLTAGSKCPSGSTLKIARVVALTQPTSFKSQTNFLPQTHETAYDRLEMQIQQLNAVPFSASELVQPGSGSRAPFVNVKAAPYYAVGDGVADDTAAIQAAWNGAGASVYMPAGTYKVTSALTLNRNTTAIYGTGRFLTVIKCSGAINCVQLGDGSAGAGPPDYVGLYDGSLNNLSIVGGTTNVIRGIWGRGSRQWYLRNISVEGVDSGANKSFTTAAIDMEETYTVNLDDVFVRYVSGDGIWFHEKPGSSGTRSNDVRFVAVDVFYAANCVHVSGTGHTFSGLRAEFCTGIGLWLDNTQGTEVSGGYFEGNTGTDLKTTTADGLSIHGAFFTNATANHKFITLASTNPGVISAATATTIQSNRFAYNSSNQIGVSVEDTTSYNLVLGPNQPLNLGSGSGFALYGGPSYSTGAQLAVFEDLGASVPVQFPYGFGGRTTSTVLPVVSPMQATSTKSAGTITLSAGSGTATTFSGARCVCTDTTANVSVKCAVSGTTLTATGTGTDVIAYLCF